MQYIFLSNISSFDIVKIKTVFVAHSIEFIIKDLYQSSLAGGWVAPGSTFNEKTLFVNSTKFDAAKLLFEKHITNY